MKFTQVPADTFEKLQLNAGIVVDAFTPGTGTIGNIIAATTGGVQVNVQPNFSDFGEDIDNVPNNTKELKRLDYYDISMSGSFVTISADVITLLTGAADNTNGHIVPRHALKDSDFDDIWWIGDYSDKNGNTNGGFLAVHMMNTLNTDGFQITSNDEGKGNFAFNFQAHYSIDDPDEVPVEFYVQAGTAEPTGA